MKLNRDMKVALGFTAFAIFYLIMSTKIETHNLYSSGGVSSRSLPTIYGIVMIILAAVLFITSYFKQKKEGVPAKEEKKPGTTVNLMGRRLPGKAVYLCATILLFAVYAFAYARLGFVISGIIYMGCMIMLLTPSDRKSVRMTVFSWVFAVVFTVILYLLFTKALSMVLPRGILG